MNLLKIKNKIHRMKNTLVWINVRLDIAGKKISDLENAINFFQMK